MFPRAGLALVLSLLPFGCGGSEPVDPAPTAIAEVPPAPRESPAEEAGRPATTEAEQAAVGRAKVAMKTLGETLKAELVAKMSAEGPVAAADVCSTRAQGLTAEVASAQGVRVGRSSLRLRNPANAAPPWVQSWLEAQGERPSAGVEGQSLIVDGPAGPLARAIAPLAVAAPCLACHGPREAQPPELAALIAERYPQDQAVGYGLDELRGAMWAEVAVASGP